MICEFAETTKLRIVFDALAKTNNNTFSLIDFLETAPPLQNALWYIPTISTMIPVILCQDMEKVFLKIRIRENEINILRFYLIKNLNPSTCK